MTLTFWARKDKTHIYATISQVGSTLTLDYVDPAIEVDVRRWLKDGFMLYIGRVPNLTTKYVHPDDPDFLYFLQMYLQNYRLESEIT